MPTELSRIVGFLSGDYWVFRFTAAPSAEATVLPLDEQHHDRTVLLSGGADSAAGALLSAFELGEGSSQALVSHFSATAISPTQQNLVAAIQNLVNGIEQVHHQFHLHRGAQRLNGTSFRSEPSTRSRSLLFLALGLAVAERAGAVLWIPENGFASLNPPLGPDRRGSLSTHTTHPRFLRELAALVQSVDGHGLIQNPFEGITKGEMFRRVADAIGVDAASSYLSSTNSCSHTDGRYSGASSSAPCGVCFGCLVRRSAFAASGVPDRTAYLVNDTSGRFDAFVEQKSIVEPMRDFVSRGIRARDVIAMSLPPDYPAAEAHGALPTRRRGTSEPVHMTRQLPPLDLHAHVNPNIRSADLERLGAVVFAATRSLDEYESVRNRRDQVTIWGVGCHPEVVEAQDSYDPARFAAMLSSSAYVSEVGLDRRSKVPLETQERVLASILDILQSTPRITSIHSSGLPGKVLDLLEEHPIRGAVLHWWRGNEAQTRRAIELGCWFSINAAGMKYPEDVARIPLDRLLTETDHPSGDRKSPAPRQPGAVSDVEAALADLHRSTPTAIRGHIWSNFVRLIDEVEIETLLPPPVQRMVAHAGLDRSTG